MLNIFESARVKLTAWYLVIIMTISLSFSAFIYKSVDVELQRRFNAIEKKLTIETPKGWKISRPVHDYFLEDLLLTKKKVLFLLFYANGTIFVLSALAGYYLAGKTLVPIEKSMEEQKRFVADASHELRTPLTVLQTSIEVALRDKKLKLKDAKGVLAQNLKDVKSLTGLSNNLLTLSRLQQNGHSLTFIQINLKETINGVCSKFLPLAKAKKITIRVIGSETKISANKESIEKLITILIDNAIKYTPEKGEVIVRIKRGKDNVTVSVRDSGIGIFKKDTLYIFERFYRADSSRCKTKVDGFGLGLAMAKRIVELHKGSIKVKSELGKGSTFTIKLLV